MDKIFVKCIRRNLVTNIISRSFSHGRVVRNTDKDIVESLERLALVDFPTETGVARLEKCIEYVDKLMKVNTTSVEPLICTVCERNENLREDSVFKRSEREELMKIAPVTEEFYYVAPLGTFSRNQQKPSS